MNKYLTMFVLGISVLCSVLFFGIHTTTAKAIISPKYDADGFLINQPGINQSSTSLDISSASQSVISSDGVKKGQIANCFDYYSFGSVGINLNTDQVIYKSGNPVIIKGVIKNNNKYPVVGLDIKARVIKNIPNPVLTRAEIMILDEFDVAKDINIDTGGEFKVSSTYKLPQNSPSGDYQVLFYAVEQNRFNLSGLSFTNDIASAKVSFNVEGKTPEHVYLDQTQIFAGGQPHNVMAFMTQHDPNVQIPITIPLNNPSGEAKKMKVTYNLYSWDYVNPDNQVGARSEEVTVPAESSIKLTYTIDKGVLPVYYLKIVAESADRSKDDSISSDKTISNIRLVVKGESKPRLNFVGVDSYPLKKGVEATLVTCFHNTNNLIDTNITKIETIIYDQNKKELSRTSYEGTTIPDITGLINKFTPNQDITEFTIVSDLIDAKGDVIDSVKKVYSCKTINPSSCSQKKPMSANTAAAVVGVIVIIAVIAIVYKKKIVNKLKV